MCDWHGGTYAGNVSVELARPYRNGTQRVNVDACIAPIVQALNTAGIMTLNSCCGHGVAPGWIALDDGRQILIVASLEEAQSMLVGYPSLEQGQKMVMEKK